jgi:hypothetical protein
MKHKLVTFPSLHIETPKLSLNEESPEKPSIWILNGSFEIK